MGSAHGKTATPMYPPTGMRIVAIQFLADNTPTVLESEKLSKTGGMQYTNTESQFNFNGTFETNVTNGSYSAGAAVLIAQDSHKINKGQYVLLINQSDTNTSGVTVDAETLTPMGLSTGVSQGCYVTNHVYGDSPAKVQLSCDITPSSQSLVFLSSNIGVGGQDASGITYPKGLTIYGRWVKVTPSADTDGGIICYYGY